MKKSVKSAGILALLLMVFVVGTAFTITNSSSGEDYSCTLTLKYSDGSKAVNVKVTTEVSGGISCVGGRGFYTDKSGEVTLNWAKGCYLKKIYVKGTGYKVDYQDGQDYTLTLD
ncbi:MAG: hypothetical protein KBC43_10970 [Bacteroidales bacterium]|nr:hypothetical protein [Bacteroidales bacterium]